MSWIRKATFGARNTMINSKVACAHKHKRWDMLEVSSDNGVLNHREKQIYGGQIHGVSVEDKIAN